MRQGHSTLTVLLLFFAFADQVCHIAVCCPTNEELGVCDGGGLFPQNYCDGVAYEVKTWNCRPRRKSRCVCKKPLWRRKDGKCVQKSDCGDKRNEVQRASITKPTVDFDAVLTFLKNNEPLHLQMMSLEEWFKNPCECLRSSFLAAHINSSERTLDCYKYLPITRSFRLSAGIAIAVLALVGLADEVKWSPKSAPDTVKETIGKTRLAKKVMNTDFEVSENNGKIHIQLLLIQTIVPTNIAPIILPYSYTVEEAQNHCLLLTYVDSANGHQYCLLWGLSSAAVDNDTDCYKKMSSICPDDMYGLTESKPNDPCEDVDRYEKWIEKQKMQETDEAANSSR